MVLVDIIAIEAALFFGYLARTALSLWRPIELVPSTYAGMIIGVLLPPGAGDQDGGAEPPELTQRRSHVLQVLCFVGIQNLPLRLLQNLSCKGFVNVPMKT